VPLHDARAERHGSAKGPEPKPPRDTPEPDEQINLSDPDARLMRKGKREGYTQSDNAQAIVDADGSQFIVGQRVSTCAADVGETAADRAAIPLSLGTPTAALADCDYADKATIERLGRDRPGLDLYINVHRKDTHAERRYDWRPLDKIKAPKTPTDPILIAMAENRRQSPLPAAGLHRRACLRHHQKRARLSAVFAAGLKESQRRMEPHLPGLQPQTTPHPAADGDDGLNRAKPEAAFGKNALLPRTPPVFQPASRIFCQRSAAPLRRPRRAGEAHRQHDKPSPTGS